MVQARLQHDRGLREDADNAHRAPRFRSGVEFDDAVGGRFEHDGEEDGLTDGGVGARERDLGVLRPGEGGKNRQDGGERTEERQAPHATARARRRKKASNART